MKDDDFKLVKGFALGWTKERMDEQTFAIVESLSRLKIEHFFGTAETHILLICIHLYNV